VIAARLLDQAGTRADRPFLRCGTTAFSFGEMAGRADQVASGLAAAGVQPGDHVAILSPNRPEMLELYFGCARLGAVQVPLNAFLKGEFLRYQLDDCEATTLVVDAAGYAAAEPLLGGLPNLRRLVLLDPIEPDGRPTIETVPYAQLAAHPGRCDMPLATAESLMSIVYTSGTTGLPKGCLLTHGYYLRVAQRMTEALTLSDDDVLLTALPLFHGAARMMVVGAALAGGASAVIEPAFQPAGFLDRAAETGATVAMGVGAMGMALLATPPSPADRAHRLRLAMWIPFPPEQQERFEARFGVPASSELYGQTECVPVTLSLPGRPRHRASAGRPASDLDVRIMDDDDHEAVVGMAGEIAVRSREPHAMFAGYWSKPEATAQASRNGWYHTGDYGRQDEDGFIFFVDRKKDALRRRGENVSSIELEAAIAAHPKIAEAAVHAVPSELTEDEIKVCLVLVPGAEVSPDELFGFFRETLPYYAIPRYIEVLTELPKNGVARVMKHMLRERGLNAATWDLEALSLTVGRDKRR
jgi:crotonobetaine/carnitine-CoA ligase